MSVVLVFSACLLVACGGGGGGGLTLDQYAVRADDVVCTVSVRCGSLPDRASCTFPTDVAQAKADVQSGKTKFDGVAGAECLDSLEAYDCLRSTLVLQSEACQHVAIGTVADGGPCNTGTQCASLSCVLTPTSCDRDTTCCAGTCQPRPIIAEGGDCSGVNTICSTGLYCGVAAGAPTCMKRPGMGAACTTRMPCLETLRCEQSGGAAQGICVPYPKRGEPCGAPSSTCNDQHDFCDPTTGTCLARLAVGATCGVADSACVYYAVCDPATNRCVKRPGFGEPCTDDDGCLGQLVCANGACVVPPPQIVCP